MKLDWVFGLMPYGDEWRRHRRMLASKFGPVAVQCFHPVQEYVSGLLVDRLLETPDDLDNHCRLYVSSPIKSSKLNWINVDIVRHAGQSILMSTYGVLVESAKHEFVVTAQVIMDAIAETLRPGAMLIDILPICKFL
jgi:cytochrome P450